MMSSTVELRMPENYVLLEPEEMMYLEGGRTLEATISARQCGLIAAEMGIGAYVLQAVGKYCPVKVVSVVSAAIAGGLFFGAALFARGAAGNGIGIYSRYSTGGTVNPIPQTKVWSAGYL